MLMYCLKYNKKYKNSRVGRTNIGKLTILPICAVCDKTGDLLKWMK